MKRFSLAAILLLSIYIIKAQNTGIGITTPRARLHVASGASGNTTPFSPFVVESNTHTYINLLSPDANETSVLFGKGSDASSGGIVYNNLNTPNGFQFRSNGNITRMTIRNDGNVGIGTSSPNAPLGFPPSLGKKITLYPGASGDVGIAVQGNLLQIYSDNPNADIAFGYDQGGSFTERLRVRGNGAFVVNGSTGSPGQVLQTNGAETGPTWTSPTNLLFANTFALQTPQTILTTFDTYQLPGLSYNLTTTSNTKVLVNFSINAQTAFCVGCDASTIYLLLNVNGSEAKRFGFSVSPNLGRTIMSGTMLLQLGPGSHTISFSAFHGGPIVYIGDDHFASHVILQIIPQ